MSIAVSAARHLARRPGELLTLAVCLPILVLIARAWLGGLPDPHRNLVALGASALVAMLLSKGILERLWFHQTDGVLARFAQKPRDWFGFVVLVLAAGLLLSMLGLIAIDILPFKNALVAAACGVLAGLTIPFLRQHRHRWRQRFSPRLGALSLQGASMPIVGASASAAAGTICTLVSHNGHIDAVLSGAFGLLVIVLTGRVDPSCVRYMTLMGYSSASLARAWFPMQLALTLPMLAVLLLAQNWIAAGVVAANATGLLVITALRIFAYRAFSCTMANWIVAGLVSIAGFTALTLPPAAPIIVIASIVWLVRRGSGSRWLLR